MKAFLGEPIGTFIVRTRTEAAARLLRYSDIPIADIAYRIGYASPSSLSKVFKQFYGISPLEYRNNKNFVIMKPAIIRPDLELKKRSEMSRNGMWFISALQATTNWMITVALGAVYSNSSKNKNCRWEISARFASTTMIRKWRQPRNCVQTYAW